MNLQESSHQMNEERLSGREHPTKVVKDETCANAKLENKLECKQRDRTAFAIII